MSLATCWLWSNWDVALIEGETLSKAGVFWMRQKIIQRGAAPLAVLLRFGQRTGGLQNDHAQRRQYQSGRSGTAVRFGWLGDDGTAVA